MPFAIKPQLINYHTEGQGENTVYAELLFRVIWFSKNLTSLILCLTVDFGQHGHFIAGL